MTRSTDDAEPKIEARRLPEDARLAALSRHFGGYLLRFHATVQFYACALCSTYQGGDWRFFELSNGGFYMAPESPPLRLTIPSNYFEGELSADAAGITFCIYACSDLAYALGDDRFARHASLLKAFASTHRESGSIGAAID